MILYKYACMFSFRLHQAERYPKIITTMSDIFHDPEDDTDVHYNNSFDSDILKVIEESSKTLRDAMTGVEDIPSGGTIIALAGFAKAVNEGKMMVPPAGATELDVVSSAGCYQIGSVLFALTEIVKMSSKAGSVRDVVMMRLIKRIHFIVADEDEVALDSKNRKSKKKKKGIDQEDVAVDNKVSGRVSSWLKKMLSQDAEASELVIRALQNASTKNLAFDTRRTFVAVFKIYLDIAREVCEKKHSHTSLLTVTSFEKAANVHKWLHDLEITHEVMLAAFEQFNASIDSDELKRVAPGSYLIGKYRMINHVMRQRGTRTELSKQFMRTTPYFVEQPVRERE